MISHHHRAKLDSAHPGPVKGVAQFFPHQADPDAILRRQLRDEIGKALKPWGINTTRPDVILLEAASQAILTHFWHYFRMTVIVRPGDTLGQAVEKIIQANSGRPAATRG